MSRYVYGFACLSIVLAIFTVATTSIVQVEPTEWGIMTKLPISFWIGLFFLFLFMYLGRTSSTSTGISFLLTLVYLFAVPALIVENPRNPPAYYPFSEGTLIADTGKLIIDPSYPVAGYHDFPIFLYLVAVLTLITKIPSLLLLKYFQIFNTFLISLFVWLILRTRFSTQQSFVGTMFFLASFWLGLSYMCPQSLALLIFLMIFLIVIRLRPQEDIQNTEPAHNPRKFVVLALLLCFALVLTHGLTTVLLIAGLFTINVMLRKTQKKPFSQFFLLLLITIWAVCLVYISYPFLNVLVFKTTDYVSNIANLIQAQGARVRFGGSFPQFLTMWTRLASSLIVGTMFLIALIKNRGNIKEDRYWLAWLTAFSLSIIVSSYGAEMIMRIYMFALIPISYFFVKHMTSTPKIMYTLLIVLTLLNIPANYGGLSVDFVPTSTLAGAAFYAKNSNDSAPYLVSSNTWRILLYYEPLLIKNQKFVMLQRSPESVSEDYVKTAIEESTYMINSDPTRNMLLFYYGTDLVREYLERHQLNASCSKIYDSAGFQIFANSKRG